MQLQFSFWKMLMRTDVRIQQISRDGYGFFLKRPSVQQKLKKSVPFREIR
jgi:hypothetical protein